MKTTANLAIAATAAVALLSFTLPTKAETVRCAPRTDIVGKLGQKYGEARQAIALTKQGGLLEIFVSAQGTWSILLSSPGGKSCLMAVGDNWLQQQKLVANLGPEA